MSLRPLSGLRTWLVAVAAIVLASLTWAYFAWWRLPRVLRIGVENLPPWVVVDAAKHAQGVGIRAFQTAADRLGIRIEWVVGSEREFEKQLATSQIDIWLVVWGPRPLAMSTYVTRPWFRSQFVLAVWPDRTKENRLRAPSRIAVWNRVPDSVVARAAFPQSILVPAENRFGAHEALCRHEVDAALLTQFVLLSYAVNGQPLCEGKPLELRSTAGASGWAAAAAAPGFHRAADALVDEFRGMVLDGSVSQIFDSQPGILPNLLDQLLIVAQAERERRVTSWLIGGLIAAILLLAILAARLRTARLRSEEAMELARAGEMAKRNFLSMMSHEIRTPIHGFMGMVSLMLDGRLGQKEREYAETALASAKHLVGLVDGVLDISALEAGKVKLHEDPFDLHLLIQRAASTLRANTSKELVVIDSIDRDAPQFVVGDADRLTQVVMILLANAEKFTDRGRVSVSLRQVEDGETQPVVEILVEDTGIGIPASIQERIFDKFEQADLSSTRRYGGAGLGLAVARHLVLAMGGEISVRSIEGQGSTFLVTLPLLRCSGPLPEAAVRAEA